MTFIFNKVFDGERGKPNSRKDKKYWTDLNKAESRAA